MKTIGLIGGTGWSSSAEYYQMINEETNRRLGGHHFARCILYSLNFHDVIALMRMDRPVLPLISDAAEKLICAGADCLVLCANTMHQYAAELKQRFSVPLIHIAAETAKTIRTKQLSKVGLIGTRYTMEMDFFKSELKKQNIACVVPRDSDRDLLHSLIMEELAKGVFSRESADRTVQVVRHLEEQDIEGLILGCTEFPILLKHESFVIPIFNTTEIHAKAAVDFALESTDFG